MDKNTNTIGNHPFWSKKMTGVLKTIAIVLMFIHHFFSIQMYLPADHSYSWAAFFEEYFTAPTKICVGIFAFITGYMYFFSKKKSFLNSVKSSGNLLVRYWVVAVPLIVLALLSGVYSFHLNHIVLELFGIETNVMCFAWYVYFYVFLMFFLPLLIHISKDRPGIMLFLTFILFNFLSSLVYGLISSDLTRIKSVYSNCWGTLFPAVSGYVIARTGAFQKVKEKTDKIPSVLRYVLFLIFLCGAFMLRYLFYNKLFTFTTIGVCKPGLAVNGDAVYVPVFVFCAVELLSFLERTKAIRVFEILGKYSVYMWFWHCMFFDVLGKCTKRVLYAPKNPILVLLWGIAVCVSLSVISDLTVKGLFSIKKNASKKEALPVSSESSSEKKD